MPEKIANTFAKWRQLAEVTVFCAIDFKSEPMLAFNS
jgi:hypothetical protein